MSSIFKTGRNLPVDQVGIQSNRGVHENPLRLGVIPRGPADSFLAVRVGHATGNLTHDFVKVSGGFVAPLFGNPQILMEDG